MKIKKIITAASCAALIAAASLPLAACGSKSFKKGETLSIGNYVEAYRPNGEMLSKYDRDNISVTKVNSASYSGQANFTTYGNFVILSEGYGTSSTSNVYNTINGAQIVTNAGGSVSERSLFLDYNTSLKYLQVANTVTAGVNSGKTLYSWYAENGVTLFEDVEDPENDLQPLALGKYKLVNAWDADKYYDVLTVKSYDGDIENYFVLSEGTYGEQILEQVKKSEIIFTDPLVEAGSALFAANRPMNQIIAALNGDSSFKDIEGDLASYTVGASGNDMVFYNDGKETGRVNLDGVDEDATAIAGNYLFYVKMTAVPKTDNGANLILHDGASELRYNYELHRYDIVKNKDKKFNYNVAVESLKSVYNHNTKTYDALVVSGAKLVNNVYQEENTVAYVTDTDLVVNYDVTDIDDFDMSNVSASGHGSFLYEYRGAFKVLDSNLKVVSNIGNSTYYPNLDLFSFSSSSGIGFAKPDGTIVVEPIYSTIGDEDLGYSSKFIFFDGYTIARNTLTNKVVCLRSDGQERNVSDTSGTIHYYSQKGYYTVESGALYEIYSFSGSRTRINGSLNRKRNNAFEFSVADGNDLYIINSARWTYTVRL